LKYFVMIGLLFTVGCVGQLMINLFASDGSHSFGGTVATQQTDTGAGSFLTFNAQPTSGACTFGSAPSWTSSVVGGQSSLLNPQFTVHCTTTAVPFYVVYSESGFVDPGHYGMDFDTYSATASAGKGTIEADASVSVTNTLFQVPFASVAQPLNGVGPITVSPVGLFAQASQKTFQFGSPTMGSVSSSALSPYVSITTPYAITIAFKIVCTNGPCTLSSAGGDGSVNGDPHFQGPHGEEFDFYGQENGIYSLISSPRINVNMLLAADGVPAHFMGKIGIVIGNVSLLFDTHLRDASYLEDMNKKLSMVGGKASGTLFETSIQVCSTVLTVTQRYTDDVMKQALNISKTIYYLDLAVSVPGCDDTLDGALGRLYRCQPVSPFLSNTQEEEFRVPELLLKPKDVRNGVPCVNSHMSKRSESISNVSMRFRK